MEYLNDFVRLNFNEEIQNEIKKRAMDNNEKLSMLNETDLLNAKYPCPRLENSACMAYQARPMACLIYLSSDIKTCLNFHQKPISKTRVFRLF